MTKKQDIEEFSNLTNLLADTQIEVNPYKDRIFNRLKYKLETGTIQHNDITKDGIYMKQSKWKSIVVIAGAMICLCGVFSTTSYAQEMLQSILARFQVGNMEITQYDKELPKPELNRTADKAQANESRPIQREMPKHMTLEEVRAATGINFPAPKWLSDHYEFKNSVVHGTQMVELQYEKTGEFISLLISSNTKNGISTQDEVKTETIGGKTVYFANGIVLWEHEGFTCELYQMADNNFDVDTIGKIINSLGK
ncbi:hypothetical protein [Paenibacillus sp. FSL H7-0331]|uniref:hypothetical protein n=1 Tax=Paenibacillus sp. FSL H7-0331 TaxID=1920421 RepID=UPI00096D4CD2|nr:hypothetical protein [Paenibacillus sp. FSL H7-0331]OMF11645.1 hypothetical protein BK127_24470 [Paenibacillus sp. FSL H7-0331]